MLKQYPKYKSTDIPWLLKVPEHWERNPIKAFSKAKSVKGNPELPLLSVYRDYGVILKNSRDDNYNKPGEDLSAYKVVEPTDLVLNKMKTWQGSLGVSDYLGIVSPAYIICKLLPNVFPKYIHYLLRCKSYIHEYNRLSYGVRNDQWDMRYEDFKNIITFLPSPEEQNAIVNFLNSRISEIDTFIANKQKMIELLNEKKKTIISKAVTKGIKQNVKLKPSGTEWFGDIPEHWSVIKLKFISEDIFGGSTPDSNGSNFWNGDILWVTPEDISQNQYLKDSTRKITSEGYKNCSTKLAKKGSIILTTRAPIGNAAIALVELCTNQGCKSIELRSIVVNEYYFFFIQSIQIILDSMGKGTTFKELSLYSLKNLFVLVPLYKEQTDIVNYIRSELSQIDSAITITQKEIGLIQEYKTTLISEAVTGKIDVRNFN